MEFRAKNPQLRVAAKRYRICYDDIANSYLYEKMSR